jgi:hypothetical protein
MTDERVSTSVLRHLAPPPGIGCCDLRREAEPI